MRSASEARSAKANGHSESGQATLEAAFAIPVLMVLLLLLLQPGIILYDRIVMEGAAAEGCRLLATSGSPGQAEDDFIRRRLSAVPQADIFHVHTAGCTWEIALDGDERCQEVGVRISTEVQPLPLIDAVVGLFGMANGSGNLKVEVEKRMDVKDAWVMTSPDGSDPAGWVS